LCPALNILSFAVGQWTIMRHLIIEEPFAESAIWSRRLAIFAVAVVATGLVLARLGLEPAAVLAVVGSAIILACLAVLCAGVATVEIWQTGRKGVGLLLGSAFLSALLLAYPAFLAVQAVRLPVLNDISTDLDNPPTFSLSRKALAARHEWTPPSISTAARQPQNDAYPDVQPVYLDLDADDAYRTVLSAAEARHWKVIDSVPPGGRIGLGHVDAVAHGLILGFADDITVRIWPLAGETRVDVRSVSRIGRHDFGANAARIQAFADELKTEAQAK
jgi:uncharacterized protein (DUF1499 family)